MFVSPDFLRRDALPPVVIIGGGPAGLSLAMRLEDLGIDTLVLEAGPNDFSGPSQDVYQGEVIGDRYYDLDATRLRQLGGSSMHWAGQCRPLDAMDFEARPDLDLPGWPITKADLDPHDAAARELLQLGANVDEPMEEDGLFKAGWAYSPPVFFALDFNDRLEASPRIHIALETPVMSLQATGGQITGIEIRDSAGDSLTLTPRLTVIACGGIETARLLLWSNQVSPERVVADDTALGRNWMEHPAHYVGEAMMYEAIPNHETAGDVRYTSIGIAPDKLMAHGALNAVVRLQRFRPQPGASRNVQRALCSATPQALDAFNAVTGAEATCGRQYLRVISEQAPDPENRVALSDSQRDRFGIPRTELHWRKTALDYHTIKVAFELVGRALVGSGKALIRADPHLIAMGDYPDDGEYGGHHHMGATRMAATARDGVVDADLRIHGLTNGYIAGSSVFTRGGHANPTFTIVQLSLRLADHLAGELGG